MISNVGTERLYKQIADRLNHAYATIHETGDIIDGRYTKSVEKKLRELTGRKFAKLVPSGTSAIQIALLSWGLIGKTIACANYSYVASVNQAALINKVNFYDVNRAGLLESKETFLEDAVIPVSLYGNTIDYDSLKISKNTKLIVDSAQSLGAKYKGHPDGSFGDVSIFSFARNKPIPTAGTHGALLWDDENMTDNVMTVSRNGQLGRDAPITNFGVNGIPFELQAAWIDIGLDHMGEWQNRRKHIHTYYKEIFKDLPIEIVESADWCESNYHKFAMKVQSRDELYQYLIDNDVQALKHYTQSLSLHFGSNKSFPNTDEFCRKILTLPNHSWLTDNEIETVAEKVKKFYR
jgi:UDP-2-acetamido-2-deoxy-ribo-hexuluronate aminotransferase